ncbi:MAG: metal-dependent transcriptional regulator [Oscillospiraceae bacterium]|nr:metal-dependent transcriptional regulator [Oscillospiraceae bacterium]
MNVQETTENYLETILMLHQERGFVRSVDVANRMGYSKPTISEQMKKFRAQGYVEMDESGYITLTPAGDAIAQRIYERHVIIAQMLMSLGVEEQVAYTDACKIEHDLSEESFARLRAHFSAHQKAEPSRPETT